MFKPTNNTTTLFASIASLEQYLARTDSLRPKVEEKDMDRMIDISDAYLHLRLAAKKDDVAACRDRFERFKQAIQGSATLLRHPRELFVGNSFADLLEDIQAKLY